MSGRDERSGRDVWGDVVGQTAPRRPAQRPDTPEADEGDTLPATDRYRAFKTVDREPVCLSVYTNGPANAHLDYRHYQYMLEDGRGKIFDIVFGFFVVRARGRNLLPVIHALKTRTCAFIQQYQHRATWPAPEPGEPVIEKIEIIYQASARVAMLEKGPANV